MQPLSGLLVLDFTTLLPGPLAALMLAEAGAEVVKIERPGGEDMRRYPPFWEGESAAFALLNRGKTSLVADLKSKDGQTKLNVLLEKTDVLVEQFRPGVMNRLGFGYDAVRALNPRLIYCSISGYGQSGPRAGEAGHDLNYIGNTGLLSLQPGPADRPVVPPALVADIGGGTGPAVINILLALRQREQTGNG
jgi:crotonobetainyl-CoA:carnitine CoA-transferase CaiB-like acyl-CoA transferase